MATLDNTTGKKVVAMADLFKRKDIQDNYMANKTRLSTDDIVDRLIHIKKCEFKTEPSMKSGEDVEFMYMYFTLDGDEKERYIKTQSIGLLERMKAIPQDVLDKEDVTTMILKKQVGQQKTYCFAGVA